MRINRIHNGHGVMELNHIFSSNIIYYLHTIEWGTTPWFSMDATGLAIALWSLDESFKL